MKSQVIGVQHQLAVRCDTAGHRDPNALQHRLCNAGFRQHGTDLLGDDGRNDLPASLERDAFLRQQLPTFIQYSQCDIGSPNVHPDPIHNALLLLVILSWFQPF